MLRNTYSLTRYIWWDKPHWKLTLVTHCTPKAQDSHRDNRTACLLSNIMPLWPALHDWAQTELCCASAKTAWWYRAYIFVVICVFQVKLQTRRHFNHDGTCNNSQCMWSVYCPYQRIIHTDIMCLFYYVYNRLWWHLDYSSFMHKS